MAHVQHRYAYKRKEREETVVGLLCFGRRSGATSKPMEIKDSVGRRVTEHLSNKFLPLSPCRQKTQSASTFLKSLGFSTPAPMPLPSPHSSRVATFRRLGGKEMLLFPSHGRRRTRERESGLPFVKRRRQRLTPHSREGRGGGSLDRFKRGGADREPDRLLVSFPASPLPRPPPPMPLALRGAKAFTACVRIGKHIHAKEGASRDDSEIPSAVAAVF